MAIRAVVVLSDIHAGSTVALLPPGFVTLEGTEIGQSPIQRWLWECWTKCNVWIDDILGGDAHALVFNGDLIEGNHHGTKQVISPDVNDHVDAGIDIIKGRVAAADRTFFVKGTECHVGNSEIIFGKALLEKGFRVEKDPSTGLPAFDRLTLDVCGVRCVFRHHIPSAVRPYLESSQFSIQMGSEIMEAVRNGEQTPRVLCCAHRHRFGQFSDGHSLTVISPPWQMLTRHGHKVVSQARTKPGAYILDWRGVPDGKLPKVHELLFDAPHPAAIAL
jgi:hypothetical protein